MATLDKLEDNKPGTLPDPSTFTKGGNAGVDGNSVVVDHGNGLYSFYAHLQPGSVQVEVGDKVKTGDQLGLLGNTGNSSAPHLHFHVMDAPSGLVADGLPYVFSNIELTGQIPPLDETLALVEAGEALPITVQRVGSRHDALPLGRDVMTFPD